MLRFRRRGSWHLISVFHKPTFQADPLPYHALPCSLLAYHTHIIIPYCIILILLIILIRVFHKLTFQADPLSLYYTMLAYHHSVPYCIIIIMIKTLSNHCIIKGYTRPGCRVMTGPEGGRSDTFIPSYWPLPTSTTPLRPSQTTSSDHQCYHRKSLWGVSGDPLYPKLDK